MLWHARIFFVRHFEKSLWPKDHRLFLFYIILKAYETIAPQAG